MRRLVRASAFAGALSAAGGGALAADTGMPVVIGIVKPGTLAKFVAKGPTFPMPPDPDAPSSVGASLGIFDTGGDAGSDTWALPAGAWKGLGKPAGSKGFKYKGAGSGADPCKVVIVKPAVIKAVCKGPGVGLTPPFAGAAAIVLAAGGTRYCASLGGEEVKNVTGSFKRKNAPAPLVCPAPSGATTTSTSVTTTSTSTVPCTNTCGNDAVEGCETCDDGNASDEDTCPSDCRVDPCSPTATVRTVSVSFGSAVPAAGLTIFLDYPEGAVSLPGSGGSLPAGTITDTPPGAFVQANDFDHALREVIVSGSAIPNGLAFRAHFVACEGAPVPTAGEFSCLVTDASDPFGNTIGGVTCSVTVP
jgi:hypothetical protein